MHSNGTALSIILPAFNSAAVLAQELPVLIGYLNSTSINYEIIITDDGSNPAENAAAIASRYQCRYTSLPVNQGKGAALRNGFSIATGSVQLFTDSDLPFEFSAIAIAFEAVQSGQADLVIGDRTDPHSLYYMKITWLRKLGSHIISAIGRRLLRNHIVDTQCGFKAFSAETARTLFPASITNRFGIDFELLYMAGLRKFRVKKIPVQLRTKHASSVHVVKDGLRIIGEIFTCVRYHAK